ncbi:hypothetical protein HY463_00750 [Candidatus Peregrinibacteria bacterium]|nr:hypothetical protein [Candidatus Peregrinibacteria bacterium]
MSLTERIKQGYLRLSGAEKAILIGSGITMLSPLLPWYDSIKGYIPETIIGVSGPLFLVGLLTMIFGAVTFFQIFWPMIGRSQTKRNIASLANFCGFQAILMLIISNSVFFSPDYGISVTHKGTRFGMFFVFIGAVLMIFGAYFAKKRAGKTNFVSREVQNTYPSEPIVAVDARERYRAMSSNARSNLWQKQSSPFARLDALEKEIKHDL